MRANEACKPIDSPDSPDSPDSHGGEQSGVCVHHCACVFAGAFFSRFWGSKTLRRVSVRLASKRPQKGPFLGLIGWRIDGRSRAHGGTFCPPGARLAPRTHRLVFAGCRTPQAPLHIFPNELIAKGLAKPKEPSLSKGVVQARVV